MRSGVLHSAGTIDMQQCLVAYRGGADARAEQRSWGAQVWGCSVGGRWREVRRGAVRYEGGIGGVLLDLWYHSPFECGDARM